MRKLQKFIVVFLQKSALLSALSLRLVKLTGKHVDPIHPKHLINLRAPWYLKHIKKTDTILDIGCNNGQRTLKIAKACKQVIGSDYDAKVLQLAKHEMKRLKIKNCDFQFGNAEKKLNFSDRFFDVVVLLDVLEHLNKRRSALLEINRVLKKDGLLLVSIPNVDTSWKRLQKSLGLFYFSDPDHKIEYTKDSIKKELKTSGFKIKTIEPVTLDTPLVGFIDLLGGISLSLYKRISLWRRNQALKNPNESIGFEIVCQK